MNTTYTYVVCTCVGASYINPEVVFDEEDGRGIIDDHMLSEKKKAVCRVHGS